ncbi:MAG: maleylpyruvate isomerase N-terminal domain-containing protein [Steroidobacteraceae bacterium]
MRSASRRCRPRARCARLASARRASIPTGGRRYCRASLRLPDECTAPQALLAGVPAAEWTRPTRFKDWTFDDIIGHLHIFDHAAALTLDSTELAARLLRRHAVRALGALDAARLHRAAGSTAAADRHC